MKKFWFIALAVVLALPMLAAEKEVAEEEKVEETGKKASKVELPGFEWSIGTDVVSGYHWRGLNCGGFAIQPDVALGYGGLTGEVWMNLSPMDYTKESWTNWDNWVPELDFTLKYRIVGVTVGVTQYFYFDGSKFLNFKGSEIEDYLAGEQSSTQTELFAEFNLDELLEDFPLHVGWYTMVGGDDKYIDENDGKLKRAFSTYIEASYTFGLPLGFSLTPTVGLTPWKGSYNFYEQDAKVALNNISIRANWELTLGKHFALDVYAQAMLNTAGINKTNVWPEMKDSYNNQRLNFCVGAGIWLGN